MERSAGASFGGRDAGFSRVWVAIYENPGFLTRGFAIPELHKLPEAGRFVRRRSKRDGVLVFLGVLIFLIFSGDGHFLVFWVSLALFLCLSRGFLCSEGLEILGVFGGFPWLYLNTKERKIRKTREWHPPTHAIWKKSGQTKMAQNASKQGKPDSSAAIVLFIVLPCVCGGWGCKMIPQPGPK